MEDKISGVYAIRNTQNDKVYIGSSNDIYSRFVKHRSRLNKGENGSKEFQDDWTNASDKNIFQLELIEAVDNPTKENLFEREQFYIDHFSDLGIAYNHCHNSKGGNGKGEKHPFWNRPVPEETKSQISETLTGRELSEEHRKNIGLSQIGHQRITKEVAEKIAQHNRKLTNDEVISILQRISHGEPLKSIHESFKDVISYSTVKGIKSGAAYSHIQR